MPVINRDSNNDNNNDENLSNVRNEFETLKIFLVEELYQLRQQVKKLNIEEVNFEKDRYNIFSVGSFTTRNKILKGRK